MRLAFADRDFWVGDDRYTDVPTGGLLDRDYLRARSALIARETAMCNPRLAGQPRSRNPQPSPGGEEEPAEPGHTTHFSIIDRWGNAVVMTSTLSRLVGHGHHCSRYGFLLNDSLGLFNQVPRATRRPETRARTTQPVASGRWAT